MKIGYSLVELASGTEIRSVAGLPARFDLPGIGVVDFDKPGQVMPDSQKPTHRLVERVLGSAPPAAAHSVVSETVSFDGEKIVAKRVYEAIPEPPELTAQEKVALLCERNGFTIDDLKKALAA